ncbi:hypothetical protein quinque_010931 [Culex quinquefasciatus]
MPKNAAPKSPSQRSQVTVDGSPQRAPKSSTTSTVRIVDFSSSSGDQHRGLPQHAEFERRPSPGTGTRAEGTMDTIRVAAFDY